MYEVFRGFYNWGRRIGIYGLPAHNGHPALRPFAITHTQQIKKHHGISVIEEGDARTSFSSALFGLVQKTV
jgi:hypothetical protein